MNELNERSLKVLDFGALKLPYHLLNRAHNFIRIDLFHSLQTKKLNRVLNLRDLLRLNASQLHAVI